MLVFNEGVPRAGKSYDAVKNHILPNLKKRRRVFARLNGLSHERIAAHLSMPLDEVQDLLVLVDTKDVSKLFACEKDAETGQWCIPDQFKDSLVVIDEVHEFYVSQRLPLPDAVENFWALLGQNGGDAVIMTQWINRVHQAVRARIERKNVFQKLTAVGLKSRYRVTFWHTTSPGKYEKVGGKTEKYDPAIYPLYHGYAVGAENTEVYDEGGTNVWRAMALRGIIFGTAGLIGAYFFVSFFFQDGKVGEGSAKVQAVPGSRAAGPTAANPAPVMPMAPKAAPPPDPFAGMTIEQRYVAELTNVNRIRLVFRASMGDRQVGMVEWVDSSGNTADQLTFDQLIAMGYKVKIAAFGVTLSARTYESVATAWPRQAPRREPEARLYRLDREGGGAEPASGASGGGAGLLASTQSGGTIIGVANRPMATFPESVQNRYSGR